MIVSTLRKIGEEPIVKKILLLINENQLRLIDRAIDELYKLLLREMKLCCHEPEQLITYFLFPMRYPGSDRCIAPIVPDCQFDMSGHLC
ncbi:hypothetical protein RJ53_01565 [Methanocalculus chunghsingensis]|uniref:Uncharacterized protein n=1 Tax=Methanocalculus chunghsingensis TaxID=156457 RepID=A0A8J7W7W0_9EURY|nr:hypothetical protein [Methanocalculus chunghsingensis]